MAINVLITGVGDALGLAVIKALKDKNNINIYGGDADQFAAGLYSESILGSKCLPYANNSLYKKEILNYCKMKNIDVFIPGSGAEVISVSKFKDEFKDIQTNLLIPDYKTVMKAADKSQTIELARGTSVSHPKTIKITKQKYDLDYIFSSLELPLIIKPCRSQGAKGVKYIYEQKELEYKINEVLEEYNDILVQELIPGKQGSMYLYGTVLNKKNNFKTDFVSRSLKTKFPTGGPAIVGESLKNDQVKKYGREIINALGDWVGPVNVEFMLDPRDKQFKLIEINPRLWGYGYLATGAGINFPKLVVDLALDKEVSYNDDYEQGKVLIRKTEDIIIDKSDLVSKDDK